jgi:hypothetical protein
MENVIEVLAIYVHATFSNGCAVHPFIMGTSTRWTNTKCDVEDFFVRNSIGCKCDNNTKSKVKKEVHLGNNFSYILCILSLIAFLVGALQLR